MIPATLLQKILAITSQRSMRRFCVILGKVSPISAICYLVQIGGCITEISTKTSRVFVDFGQNLPGCAVPTTPEQDEALVRDIFAQNVKQHQAVVYTHAHEDHVGLFDSLRCASIYRSGRSRTNACEV